MKSLKELKEKINQEVNSYQIAHEEHHLRLAIKFGTKNVEVTLEKVSTRIRTIGGNSRAVEVTTPWYKIVSTLEKMDYGQAFVVFREDRKISRSYFDKLNDDVELEDKKKMLSVLLQYWQGYMELKELKAMYVSNKLIEDDFKQSYNAAVKENSHFKHVGRFNGIINSPDYFSIRYGIVEEKYEKELTLVLDAEKELYKVLSEIKTFTYTLDEDSDKQFSMEKREYYYENVYFQFRVEGNKLVVFGEKIDEQKYEMKLGVIKEVLDDIAEQFKFENLMHPPTKNLQEIFVETLRTKFATEDFEKVVLELDAIIGKGNTENECIEINKIIKQCVGLKDSEVMWYRDTVKRIKNDYFEYYYVKTEKRSWHVLLRKGFKFWLYPSKTEEYPEYIHNAFNEVMQEVVKGN